MSYNNKKNTDYTPLYNNACADGCDHHGGVNRPQDADGNTVLHLEILQSNYSAVKFLVEQRGARINIQNNDGDTPLHLALKQHPCSDEIIKLLISKGTNVNTNNNDGNISVLNIKNNDGDTPLHLALKQHPCSYEIIEFLLSEGADINIKNNKGESALSILESTPINTDTNSGFIKLAKDINNRDNQHPTSKKITLENHTESTEEILPQSNESPGHIVEDKELGGESASEAPNFVIEN